MKKRISIGVLTLLLAVSIAGCSADNNRPRESETNQDTAEDTTQETINETDDTSQDISTEESETIHDTESSESDIEIIIYHNDENSLNLIEDTVTISELSPENLLAKLAEYNLAPTDVLVNSFEEVEDEGEKALNLDLSGEYSTMIRQMGTTGEDFMLKSLCNTFLKAYDADKIKITIDGEMLVTGHVEIEGYLYFYEQ